MALLSKEAIQESIKNLDGWSFTGNSIEKEFGVKNFLKALDFVNSLGEQAEKMDHHPDIFIHSYNKVKITISTHSEGGVTEKDFKLAGIIEKLSS